LQIITNLSCNTALLSVFFETYSGYPGKDTGTDHPDVAKTLTDLADVHRDQSQYALAEPLYERALEIEEKAVGPDHPDLILTLCGQVYSYYCKGQYLTVKSICERITLIKKKALETHYPGFVGDSDLVWTIDETLGRYEQAASLILKQIEDRKKDHPDDE
jgi:tetratricopeptide (TPR) repeat protein